MPAYITSPQPVQLVTLMPGRTEVLVNNAATDSNITTTQQLAVGPDPTGVSQITVTNTTNQTATPNTASTDTSAQYEPLSVNATAITVPTSESVSFPCNARWIVFKFTTAPTSGSLYVTR